MMRFSQKSGKRIWGSLLVAPVIILFLLFFVIPLGYAIYLSFFKVGLFGQKFVGWDNYVALMRSPALRRVLWNTVRYWVCMVPASVVVPLGVALLITELPRRISGVFRVLFYLPVAVGGIVLISIWSWIFHPDYGILNYVISLVGISPRAWLGDTQTSLFAVAAVYLFTVACAHFTLVYCVAIGGIPGHFIEAAKLDGAAPFQIIRFIVVPLLKPSMLYVLLCSTLASISLWVYPRMLTGGGPIGSSTSFGYWIYETAFVYRKMGMASAQAVLMLLLVLGLCIVTWKTTYET